MSNVKVHGLNETITALNRPWVYYGVIYLFSPDPIESDNLQGSYAGARAAHMRILYPSLVFGSIASSAVTHAAIYNWEYNDLIRNYTALPCRRALEQSIRTVDHLLGMDLTRGWIKGLFGLRGLKQDQDFASILKVGINCDSVPPMAPMLGGRYPSDPGKTKIGTQSWARQPLTNFAAPSWARSLMAGERLTPRLWD